MENVHRLRVLCVDDEPNVLEGLKLHLRRGYQVALATSGAAGLEILREQPDMAIVLSDMRMPHMDGATFLTQVRLLAPAAVRMLLTGFTEIETAILAINEGQIFRFLTKPCPPQALLAAFAAAAEQHRLITAERDMLEQTLRGSIKALTDILTLAKPLAFGRSARLREQAAKMAECLGLRDRWQVEVAAMLSQIGCVALRPETAEKLYQGQPLSSQEYRMVDRLPAMAAELIAHIPRMEAVREILASQNQRFDGTSPGGRTEAIPLGARIIKIIHDYDVLETQGLPTASALDTMRGRTGWYDPELLETFASLQGHSEQEMEIKEMHIQDLKPGMIFSEDIRSSTGSLLIARGYEVTPSLLERIRNFPPGLVQEQVRVMEKK